jgi:hypothetical protein
MSKAPIFRIRLAFFAIFVATGLVISHAFAQQAQNPIKAAKDAFNKAKQPAPSSTVELAANSSSQPAPQGGTSAPIAAGDQAPAANAALDPKVLPDIVGVHLGMPMRTAAVALQASYPTLKLQITPTQMPTISQPVVASISANQGQTTGEIVTMGVVLPPNQQIVWAVSRKTGFMPGQTPLNRGTLLAALRQKYGKESYNTVGGGGPAATTDTDIGEMFWIYDEHGNRVPLPNPAFGQTGGASGCAYGFQYTDKLVAPGQGGGEDQQIAGEKAWCASTYVGVHVLFPPSSGDPNLVGYYYIDVIDIPLAVRAQKATMDWYQNIGQKQHQDEIDKSKQVQPKL